MSKIVLLGPPGTGKTTTLLNRVEQALRDEIHPSEIAYLAFTKAAADEAVERACARFDFHRNDFPYFRTIHALAFRLLGLKRNEVMSEDQWKDFGARYGYKFSGIDFEGHSRFSSTQADECLRIYQYARSKYISPMKAGSDLRSNIDHRVMARFMASLNDFKSETGLIDFYDFIDSTKGKLPVKLMIVDEAQDLTTAQWRLIHQWSEGVPEVIVAGDDDQAIFEWAGADVPSFLGLVKKGFKKKVLRQSWRIPNNVKVIAEKVALRIKERYAKDYLPRKDAEGIVEYLPSWNALSRSDVFQDDDVLVVCRTHKQAQMIEGLLRISGAVYDYNGKVSSRTPSLKAILAYKKLQADGELTKAEMNSIKKLGWKEGVIKSNWTHALTELLPDERLYFQSLERSGVDLEAPPKIRIRTIHAAKGSEAGSVVLYFDITGKDGMTDEERRILYVGLTRAKNRLVIIGSKGLDR